MSLINDALKRVKAAQQQAAPSASVGPQLKPVEPPPPPVRQGVNLLIPGVLAGIALLGLLLVWVVRNKTQSGADTPVRAHAPATALPASAETGIPASPTSTPVTAQSLNPVRAASNDPGTSTSAKPMVSEVTHRSAGDLQKPSDATNGPAAAPSASSDPKAAGSPAVAASSEANTSSLSNGSPAAITASNAVAQAETPKPAPLKLQGITYDRRRPSAVINGRTLFVGDRIRDMRVVSIQPDTATLVGQGRTNVLSLAE